MSVLKTLAQRHLRKVPKYKTILRIALLSPMAMSTRKYQRKIPLQDNIDKETQYKISLQGNIGEEIKYKIPLQSQYWRRNINTKQLIGLHRSHQLNTNIGMNSAHKQY